MIDSGSMACTLSEEAEVKMLDVNALSEPKSLTHEIVLVGCGGKLTKPKCVYEVELKVYGESCLVPVLVVPGQKDELILGTNVIKFLMHQMKVSGDYWRLISRGGSTVVVEPTSTKTMPRHIMVGRTVTPLWGDGWIPMKVANVSDHPITLKRNSKLADVSPCLAVEDFDCFQGVSHVETASWGGQPLHIGSTDLKRRLQDVGLGDIDIDSCSSDMVGKERLVQLLEKYNDIFSKHPLDCGEAKGFVHRIRLMDERPFRLPYRRVPPAHYQKLRQVLSEMEEQGIIRKSASEYASPLVLVWKKDGSLRICTDFRWLNARTIKDAHPLPHQADCLAALGGNVFFSTMDLTSGFYNIPMAEEDKKYTAFTTPLGLHEYNRMPQGLSNSPASFMRMMLSIFGDLNFSSLLCYLDDLLVYAPNEEESLKRLEVVFLRLRLHNLKLSPKKCHLMQASVRFLGHYIDSNGVSLDPSKVEVITKMSRADLMEEDGYTPSVKRIKSFLGMVFYYQHFIPNCSAMAKPLFALTSGQKRRGKVKANLKAGTFRRLQPTDWTSECDIALSNLKESLLHSVVLAHPDFSCPLILSIDASLDGLGAILSHVPAGEEKARPIAFASKSLTKSQKRYPAHRLEFLALKWSVCEKFSHWLKGHTFTVWTDNNPLTYIMTKPKLDACEQRWVSKLAPYAFDLKHIPGSKNTAADALSRDPFTKTVSRRLITEPYNCLLAEAEGMGVDGIQDTFHLKVQCHRPITMPTPLSFPCDSATIKACLDIHEQWDMTAELRASQAIQALQSLTISGSDELFGLTLEELQHRQESDPSIAQIMPFVNQKRRPTR
ncbi:hypothetical protein SRHO_G00028770 [Serrasalmus rhombeus]